MDPVVTAQELSDFANIGGGVDVSVLQQAILDAESQLSRVLGDRPISTEPRTIVIDGLGGFELQLPYSVSDTKGFILDVRASVADAWEELDAAAYELDGRYREPDMATRVDGLRWPRGQRLVRVTMIGGWTRQTAPNDIKGQVLIGAARIIRTRPTLRGQRGGDQDDGATQVAFDEAVIAPYRAKWREAAEHFVR